MEKEGHIPQTNQHWHAISDEEVLHSLDSDQTNGLTSEEAVRRTKNYGLNELKLKKAQHPVIRFLLQFHQPLVYILLAAALVTLFLQEWVDTGVILAVVLINSIIGFVQESKALKAIDALAHSLTSENIIIRDGKRQTLASTQIVPGDIVVLQSGDKVPADLRILKAKDLQIDESALTGESVPSEKDTGLFPEKTSLADRRNMAYSTTFVTYGAGLGVVTETGNRTEIGRISELIANTDDLETPLTKRIAQFSHYLLYAILILSFFAFVLNAIRGTSMVDSFMASVALAVAAIPEGLPAAVTIMLAIGVSRMAQRRAIIRRLPAVETLGSTTIVCSDKTGTLTKNQMTVRSIATQDGDYEVSGTGYGFEGEIRAVASARTDSAALQATIECGVVCNNAKVEFEEGLWRVQGDPTEGAMISLGGKASIHPDQTNQQYPRLDELPFESANQYMATLNQSGASDNTIFIKGSLEAILARCNQALDSNGQLQALDQSAITQKAEQMASEGLRVLAFAKRSGISDQHLDHDMIQADLIFLGLQGMIDPPRSEAIEAIKACHKAGVGVKMITGDHALTAQAIAGQLGLITNVDSNQPQVMTGAELNELTDEELTKITKEVSVFARVTPDNKYRLVENLQAQGHIVAMTGDGVNDAPALKRADIGIAMALGGTEVAREASDMMLTDDNFATIRSAIEEGRGIFDNLKKFIVWTLPTNGGEGLVILLAVLLGVSLPILPVQILWINLTTAIFLGLMLVFEPKESAIMDRPPHPPNASLIDFALLIRIILVSMLLCVGAFWFYELELASGATEAQARTMAVTVFIIGEAMYLLNCRSLTKPLLSLAPHSNPWIWFGIAGMLALQAGFAYLPFMNEWFKTAPLDATSWMYAFAWGFFILICVEIEKAWRQNMSTKVPKEVTG